MSPVICPLCGYVGGAHDDDCAGDLPPLLRGRVVRRESVITPADRAATTAEAQRLVAEALYLQGLRARRCA